MNFWQNKKGYSLVEVLVAITILMVAIAGPLTIAAKSLQSSHFAKDQVLAYYLAQEGIEAFTAMRNEQIIRGVKGTGGDTLADVWSWVADPDLDSCFLNDPFTFAADGDVGCNIDFHDETIADSNSVASCADINDCTLELDPASDSRVIYELNSGATDNRFTRVIAVEHMSNRELQITSTVSWQASLFGDVESVELVTYLYKLYEI